MPELISRIRSASPWILAALFAAACGGPADAEGDADTPAVDASEPDGEPSPDGTPPDGAPEGPGDPKPPKLLTQAGGETAAIALAGGRAYVGVGPRLTIWDVEGDAATLLGTTDPLSGVVASIAVDGDVAYVTSTSYHDGALHIIDVGNVAHPAELTTLRLGTGTYSRPATIALSGDALFIGDGEQGIFRVDVSTPTAPVVTASRATLSPLQLQVVGDRLNVLEWSLFGLAVESFATTDLTPLGGAFLDSSEVGALTPDGLLITSIDSGLAVDELDDPTEPHRLFTAASTPSAIIPSDGGAWLTVDGHLRFLALGDRASITLGPAYDTSSWAVTDGASADGRLVLLTSQGGLELVDVSGAIPTRLAQTATGPCASCDIATATDNALVVVEATQRHVGTVSTVDAETLSRIASSTIFSVAFEDAASADGHVYVADSHNALWAFDVAAASAVSAVARVASGGYPSVIATSGDHVYVGDAPNGGTLRVFSLATGNDPAQLGAIATDRILDLAARGDLVFAATAAGNLPGGLMIYDTADPANIELIGYADDCSSAIAVEIAGPVAVLACADGVHVIDIANPASPSTIARWQPSAPIEASRAVAIDDTFVSLGHARGVTVLDVSSPTTPVVVAELPTAWPVRDLLVPAAGRIVATTTRGGLYQWER
jgi:hypothetical protein